MIGYIVEVESQVVNTILQPVAEIIGAIDKQDIKIDITNNVEPGPQGPAGPRGIVGPQGPKGDTARVETQYFTLTQEDIDRKSLTLNEAPTIPMSAILYVIGGIPQMYGIDYIVSGNTLYWENLGLDNFLEVNDVVVVTY